jgi:hypothetical protein
MVLGKEMQNKSKEGLLDLNQELSRKVRLSSEVRSMINKVIADRLYATMDGIYRLTGIN